MAVPDVVSALGDAFSLGSAAHRRRDSHRTMLLHMRSAGALLLLAACLAPRYRYIDPPRPPEMAKANIERDANDEGLVVGPIVMTGHFELPAPEPSLTP
jgi:hypothetical protein